MQRKHNPPPIGGRGLGKMRFFEKIFMRWGDVVGEVGDEDEHNITWTLFAMIIVECQCVQQYIEVYLLFFANKTDDMQ